MKFKLLWQDGTTTNIDVDDMELKQWLSNKALQAEDAEKTKRDHARGPVVNVDQLEE